MIQSAKCDADEQIFCKNARCLAAPLAQASSDMGRFTLIRSVGAALYGNPTIFEEPVWGIVANVFGRFSSN
jgi:hypothetical protein